MPVVLEGVYLWAYYAFVVAYAVYSQREANRQRRLARERARDAYNASLEDRLVMTDTVDGARSRVYGRARNVDGRVFKGTHGEYSKYYTMVVALAGHECDAIEEVFFNDQKLELASDGAGGFWVRTDPFLRYTLESDIQPMTVVGTTASYALPATWQSGSVHCVDFNSPTGAEYVSTILGNVVTCTVGPGQDPRVGFQYRIESPKARIWKYLGTSTQNIGADLLASRFPDLVNTPGNDDRFAGICCVAVELEYDQDAFPLGVPNVTATLRGARILNQRTGAVAWSQNNGDIINDWSLYPYGGGCAESEIKSIAFIAAANACDISTNFVTTAGIENRPLYQCDIVCKLDAAPDSHLAEMVESMAGKWGWAGGQLTLVAGVYRAPVAHITEDWVQMPMATEDGQAKQMDLSVVKDPPISDVVNVYRPSIANADADTDPDAETSQAYVVVPMPEVRSEAYIEADGRELSREVQLGGVTHNVHAQHICGVIMRDQRDGMVVRLPSKLNAWQLELFDTVTLSLSYFGFVAKEFEVLGWVFSVDQCVELVLKETGASIFDPASGLKLPNAIENSALVLPWVVPIVTGVTVTSAVVDVGDGSQQTRLMVSWDPLTAANVIEGGRIEVQYLDLLGETPPGDWPGVMEQGSAVSTVIPGLKQGRPYLIRARAINALQVRGDWNVHTLQWIDSVPLVQTVGLALGAATEIVTGTLDTTVYNGAYSGPIPGQVAVTPAVDCKMTVVTTGALSAANSSGSAKAIRAIVYTQITGATGTQQSFRRSIANGETWQTVVSISTTFDVLAGVTYYCGLGYSDHVSATQVSSLTNVQTRVELVKR